MSYIDAGYAIALSVISAYGLTLVFRRRRLERSGGRRRAQAMIEAEPPDTTEQPPAAPRQAPSQPSARFRARYLVVGLVLVGAIAFLLFKGLSGSLDYFDTVDQAVAAKATLGSHTLRLEGLVVPGTVMRTATGVDFVAAGTRHRIQVINTGNPPQLFQPNIPVVVVGYFSGDTFVSNQIIVDHSAQYIEQYPGRVPRSQRQLAMNAELGHIGVLLGLAAALVGAAVLAVGLVRGRQATIRSGRIYAALILAGALIGTFAMERALVTHDFSLAFVAANNSRETPLLYTITGMWSALAGSILLWGLILAGYVCAMVWRFRRQSADALVGWATLVTYLVAAFFFALMAGPADPFQTVSGAIPADGLGPNVLLQDNALVAFHPPLLYLGFVGFTIPFAFAIASLATGRVGEGWQLATRRWTLFAWAFLTVGIVLGAWWSYQVLGWGGFWAWDPVENASFLPWLCATAYLHSVLVQERRALLRVWNLSLVIATFSLTILGTFLTRSGVIESVHAFSNSDIGPLLLGFFGLVLATGVGLIAWRGDRLRSPGGIDAPVSREGAFLVNNLLFVAFAFVVLLGTVFPLLYEAYSGQQVTVGAPYFNSMTLPIGLALLLLMAVGPALSWRKSDGATLGRRLAVPAWIGTATVVACVLGGIRGLAVLVAFGAGAFAASANVRQLLLAARAARRHRAPMWRGVTGRANGGMVVHIGVVVIAVALASATTFGHRGQVTLSPGQSGVVDGHRITFVSLAEVNSPARSAQEALVLVDGRGPLRPAVSQFGAGTEAVGTPAIDSGVLDDVYLTIDSLPAAHGGPVSIGVTVQPLVFWLWVGGAILVVGAGLAALPGRRTRRPTEAASALPAVAVTGPAGVSEEDDAPSSDELEPLGSASR